SGLLGSAQPRRRRGPVAPGVPRRPVLVDGLVLLVARGPLVAQAGNGLAGRRRRVGPRPGSLAASPILERRTDREGRGKAVRLLVGERARGRGRLGIAAMAMVRAGRPLVTVVDEGDEGTGDGAVDRWKPSLGHRGEDTPPRRRSGWGPDRCAPVQAA